MKKDVQFGRLEDLPLREAWEHEAHEFTPWLAENIDHIGEAIGIPLELVGAEVAVEGFSADILARNPIDDSAVLIENQLGKTDHTHLGQIMTYLAGLEARTVVWIAARFREPHLSAIRWLNENTGERFSFFAVRLRVVRIGDSPFAPVFEIEEEPNDWERQLRHKVESEGASYYDVKERFWAGLLDAEPELADLGVRAWRNPNNYIQLLEEPEIDLSLWLGKTQSGVFVRSGWGKPVGPVLHLLEPHAETLEKRTGAPLEPQGKGNHLLAQKIGKGHVHEEDWPEIMTWMKTMVATYRAAFDDLQKDGA